MEYKFKAGQRVRILDVPSLGDRKRWAGREVTLKEHDVGGKGWDVPAWNVEESDCHYRFRESEMAPLGPIRTETVTVRRLEPGVYGRLEVGFGTNGVSVGLTSEVDGKAKFGTRLSAPELRELARVALEIAEYLDAQ